MTRKKSPLSLLGGAVLGVALLVLFAVPCHAQVIYIEAETAGGSNDTFALAEDCRQIGSRFVIRGTVHQGNANSDDEWFMFNGAAGACVNIDFAITQTTITGNPYQLNVWLYNSSQTLVAAWNTVSAVSSANFGIGAYTLPATDTYYIYVTEWSVAPNAISQPGIVFTPLSVRGFGVTGATPDSTRNAAGGNQTFGSRYEITVRVSSGNDAAFDVFVDCDPATGAVICSPDPADICWMPGGAPNARFQASSKCPAPGVIVSVLGGSSGLVAPGMQTTLTVPGPAVATSYTVDAGAGPVPGGQIRTVRALITQNGQTVSQVDVCAGNPVCLDVCGPVGSTFTAALANNPGPPIIVSPFLPQLELDINSPLFMFTFPVNQLAPIVTGFSGLVGNSQMCFALPPGLIVTPQIVHLQAVTQSGTALTGLTPRVVLNLVP